MILQTIFMRNISLWEHAKRMLNENIRECILHWGHDKIFISIVDRI